MSIYNMMLQEQKIFVNTSLDYLDVTYGITWDKSDFEKIKNIHRKINQFTGRKLNKEMKAKKELLIDEYEHQINRSINDMSSTLEPLDYTMKFDRVLNGGRQRAAELITGERGDRFDYACVGGSLIPVTDADVKLFQEFEGERINIRQNNGFISASGSVIKHSGLWSPGESSMIIFEVGFVDTDAYDPEQTLWSRTVFPSNKPINHFVNADFFSVTHSAYTTSSE